MNVLNRVLAIILLIIFVVLLAVLIFAALAMPERAVTSASQAVASLQPHLTMFNRLVFSGLALLVAVAGVLLLFLEIRRSQVKAIQVHDVTGGEVRITIDSISQRLEYNISRLEDVVSVKPTVTAKGSGVDVALSIQTAPEIDVPMKTEEVVQLTREVIENQMGLKLQKVSVEIKHAPYSGDKML